MPAPDCPDMPRFHALALEEYRRLNSRPAPGAER